MAKKPAAKKIVRQLTPEKDLNNLLRQCKGHEKNIAEYVGSLREKIGNAKEKKHLHTGAFAVVRRLDKMEPEKVAEFLDHFNHYLDVSGIQQRADDAPALDLEGDAGAGDGGEQTEDETKTRRGGPRLVPAAGADANVG